MRDVNLPCAFEHPRRRDDEAVLAHRPAVDEGRRVTGDEDENFRSVAKSVVADRKPAHGVGRNMVEEDQPKRESAEQIKPEIAFGRNRGHVRLFFRVHFRQ